MTEPQLFQSAIRHHQAGQLADAERIYRQILAADPKHFDSLHLLGILAHQVRRHEAAIDLIGRAIACNDRVPECHYNMGLALAAAGRMQDAATSFGHAIALKGDYAEAHMNLGNAQKNLGHVDEAIASLERALALKPDVAELHYNIANVLAENGQLDRAVISYERALSLKPDYADAYNNLGTVLTGQGRYEEGLARHRRALALKPDLVQAHVNCGNALMAQGRLDDAAAALLEATARRPDYAEAHANLGRIYALQGKSNEAIARYRRAVSIDPDLVPALVSLATLLVGIGDQVQAFEFVKHALRLRPSSEVKVLFAHCVRNLEATSDSAEHRALVLRALAEGWGRPKEFARFATGLIKSAPKMEACVARAKAAYPRTLSHQELFGESGVAAVGKDSLLQLLLVSTRSQDVDLERVLMAARAELLEAAAGESAAPAEAERISFVCALARQCFINEYVFSCGSEEVQRAEGLRDSVRTAIQAGDVPTSLRLAAVAAYFPLSSLPGPEALLQAAWPEPVKALLIQQIQEPGEEQEYRSSMARLSTITDDVSMLVKQQYEENPYPRWVNPAPADTPTTVEAYLQRFAPACRGIEKSTCVEVLMAGCGTGQEAIEFARQFYDARLLAIDLSLTSLGYAKRKARALGVTNIEFAQADILALGSIGRTFDMIESNGVLHHMAEPMKGWRVLLSLLRPGGVMHVGLYSELARRDVVAARTFIAERGYRSNLDDIRRCREDIIGAPDGSPLKNLTKISDFFSASECRDLLFHVQEHRMRLPQINAFLQEHSLQFLGFDIDRSVINKYRARFPDADVLDLDRWHIFETENPDTFSSMYQFLIQKPKQ